MRQAALGFRAHSGWTSLVAIALEDGFPLVLLRQRPHLVKTFSFEFRQPYHTAEKAPRAEAPGIISRIRAEAQSLAYKSIHSVQKKLLTQGYEAQRIGLLLASGKTLPSLPQILTSHALIHTADGELFREALLRAGKRCGIQTFTAKEKELSEKSSGAFKLSEKEISRHLVSLGIGLGPPWTQDEKLAALIAWLSLTNPRELSLWGTP
jgi:hypothetical protein